jgi:hypothetical protein
VSAVLKSDTKRGGGSVRPGSAGPSRYTQFVPWRHRIAVVLLTVLAGLPISATACALVCESATNAGATHHGSGSECDESAQPPSGPLISGQSEHDCSTHSGLLRPATTTPAERADLTAKSAPLVLAAAQVESVSLRDSHTFLDYSSPPGTAPPTTTPLVLRV